MAKPIGKHVVNRPAHDKVGFRLREKFESKPAEKKEDETKREKPKYKVRKKK